MKETNSKDIRLIAIPTHPMDDQFESTYALLVRSEEKSRSALEMVIYFLCILGPVIAIWQFAQQPVNIPAAALQGPHCVVCDASVRENVSRS